MAKPTQVPDFCTNDSIVDPQSGQNNVVEPDAGQKPEGWAFQQLPPRGWMNWLHNLYYLWIKWLDEELEPEVSGRLQTGTVTVRAYSGTADNGSDVTLNYHASRITAYPGNLWDIRINVNTSSLSLDMGLAGTDGSYSIKPTSGTFPFTPVATDSFLNVPLTVDFLTTPKERPGYMELNSNISWNLNQWDQVADSYRNNTFTGVTLIGTSSVGTLNFSFIGTIS